MLNGDGLFNVDPLGYLDGTANNGDETIELTSELLADAIKLSHPDLHPPERRDLAHRVTQGLIALQPFTYPAQKKPEPELNSTPSASNSARKRKPSNDGKRKPYPCKGCGDTVPYLYCTECGTEWDTRQQKQSECILYRSERRSGAVDGVCEEACVERLCCVDRLSGDFVTSSIRKGFSIHAKE